MNSALNNLISSESESLDYTNGKHTLRYDTGAFGFNQLVLNALIEGSEHSSIDLHEVHKLEGIADNIEKFRQILFTLFRTEEFQLVYKKFGAELIDRYFNENSLIQKTPTVRIQLPGAQSTSYHSDGWYGHGKSVCSFWVPLTKVGDGNTLYMADEKASSLQCLEEIIASKASLAEINDIARKVCSPFEGDAGDVLSFSSDMIHGANYNSTDFSRVSFDFRIAPNPNDLGSKPTSNFYTREELTSDSSSSNASNHSNSNSLRCITYSNNCGAVSAKSQLMLCSAFCDANDVDVIGNESEIISLSYMPVIRHYLMGADPSVNSVAVFGAGIFNGQRELAAEILAIAQEYDQKLVFCSEGIIFDKSVNPQTLLDLV